MAQNLSKWQAIQLLKDKLPSLKQKYGVDELSIFGSVARGDNRPRSDVDILISFSETPSIFTLEKIRSDLVISLKARVDLVVDDNLDPSFKKRIWKERIII